VRHKVALGRTKPVYCSEAPFHPDQHFPEMLFTETSPEPNGPYALLRKLLNELGLDSDRFGTPEWNPLGTTVAPGQTVVIKPNFVLHRNESGGDPFAVMTHPSVIRAVVDYTFLALAGQGRIVIADAPMMTCDWQRLMELQQLDTIQQFYRNRFGFEIEVYDLRPFALIDPDKPALSGNRKVLPGDPLGSVTVDLGSESLLDELESKHFYGADYDRTATIAQHHENVHRYRVSRTVLSADAVISVPKMKTHKKVGVTLNAKGLVGINTDKNCLVHYRVGTPKEGGDQLPDTTDSADRAVIRIQRWCYDNLLAEANPMSDLLYRALLGTYRLLIKPLRELNRQTAAQDSGNWHGNDSAWRMTADLLRILLFADRGGKMVSTPQRKIFCIVDGIIGGDGEGPLAPFACCAGLLTAGADPVSVDLVTARVMGLDPRRIKQFLPAYDSQSPLFRNDGEISVHADGCAWAAAKVDWPFAHATFVPHSGWIGHIEWSPGSALAEMVEMQVVA